MSDTCLCKLFAYHLPDFLLLYEYALCSALEGLRFLQEVDQVLSALVLHRKVPVVFVFLVVQQASVELDQLAEGHSVAYDGRRNLIHLGCFFRDTCQCPETVRTARILCFPSGLMIDCSKSGNAAAATNSIVEETKLVGHLDMMAASAQWLTRLPVVVIDQSVQPWTLLAPFQL